MSNPDVVVDVETDADDDDNVVDDNGGDDHDEDPDEGEDSFDVSVESSAPSSTDKRRRRPGLLEQRALASGSFERIVAALPKPKAPAKPTFSLRRAFSLNDSAAWQNERCFLQRKLS